MLKLMKYEYRKNLVAIAGILAAILLLEGFFLFAVNKKDPGMVSGAAMMLMMAAFICVLGMMIYSVSLYSKELGSKSSYLTFMTPNSAVRILGAKLLSAFTLGVFYAAILAAFASWDFKLTLKNFPQLQLGEIMLEQVLLAMGEVELSTVLSTLCAIVIEFLVDFFTVVVVAYLAITLSATVLHNKKLKGFLSVVLFFAVMAALSYGTSLIPADPAGDTLMAILIASWPRYAIYVSAVIGSFWLSAWLLENKVSL